VKLCCLLYLCLMNLWRRRSKLLEEINIVVMGNVASSPVTCCPQEPDPLVLALCEGTKPPVWVDPMFNELAASLQLAAPLIVSHSVDASVLGRPSTPPAAPFGAQALLADTRSHHGWFSSASRMPSLWGWMFDELLCRLPPQPLLRSLLGASPPRSRPPSSRRHHVVEPVTPHPWSPSVVACVWR
jgi:hypothetical protein